MENINTQKKKRRSGLPSSLVHEKFLKACQSGRLRDVEAIVSAAAQPIDVNFSGSDRKTPLFHAITSHSLPLVKFLLKAGVDVAKRSFVFFRLDCSAFNFESCDEPPVVTAARAGTTEILRCLLQNGANANEQPEIPNHHHKTPFGRSTNINGEDNHNRSPAVGRTYGGGALHFACEAGNLDMVRLLLDHGADANAVDHKLERPLHLAARCRTSLCAAQREIVELLCQHGADVNAINKKECSPLYLAALYTCTSKVEVLLRHGADSNSGCSSTNGYGSALHVATYKDRADLASLLIAHGARVNHVNAQGVTPLQLNITMHCRSEIAPLLVYHGAVMNGRDRYGRTLLSLCIHNLRLDCESLAVLMVQAGYDLRDDLWLEPCYVIQSDSVPSQAPDSIPAGRVRRLCDWLRSKQETPRSLSELCRVVIRRRLADCVDGRTIVPSIYHLPLPTAVKNFVLLKDPSGSNVERPILSFLISADS